MSVSVAICVTAHTELPQAAPVVTRRGALRAETFACASRATT